MKSFLMINALFKTIEYKLVSPSDLKITELSVSGSQQSKTFSLSSINIEEGQTTPSYLPSLIILFGCFAITAVLYFSNSSSLLNNNVMSAVSFLTCIFGALAFISRPVKSQIYRDSFSGNILFKFNESSSKNNATKQFTNDLNEAIAEAKEFAAADINIKQNTKLQFEIHNNNVNELLNSGLIDEALYNRICHSMHTKVFGNVTKQEHSSPHNNVIYLNQ